MYSSMPRELRWPIAIALVVGAVTMGPKLVGGALEWVRGDAETPEASASIETASDQPVSDPAATTEEQRRW